MKKATLFTILAIFMTSLIIPTTPSAATRGISAVSKEGQNLDLYESYHALVVGISDYEKWPDLPYAVSDAEEVAGRLKELGFEVRLVLDPTSRELKSALSEMTYRMGGEKNRAVLFYYAGHGETETMADGTKMGYIVPKDCSVLAKDPIGFDMCAISMRDIESISLKMRSKHVLMLFDSCFSGALFALIRAVPDDITEKSTLPVRQYITAGKEDEKVPDRSMFKRLFLIGLKGNADMTGDGYITGSEMGMYLADNVVNYTQRRQHPQYGKINNPDLDQGDFIFVPLKTADKTTKQEELVDEKGSLAADIAELKADRAKTQKLLEEMKKLLQGKSQPEQQKKKTLAEKRELERQAALLARETEKRKELEKELEKLRRQREMAARQALTAKAPAKKKPKTVVSAPPRDVKTTKQPAKKETPSIKEVKTAKTTPSDPIKKTKTIPQKEEKIASLNVPKVKPEQDFGTLIVTCNVKDAKVYIGKKEISFWASPNDAWIYRGGVPFKSQEIGPGRHEIRVHQDGYGEEVKIVDISPGEVFELHVTLFKSSSESGDEDHGGGGGGGGGGGA